MRMTKFLLAMTVASASMILFQATDSAAASKKPAAQAASWDGTWSGKWGGKTAGKVTIKNNKVTSYYFRGYPQRTGATTVSGKTIRFGSGYSITMTMTGADSANAVWRGDGTAQAAMTR